MNKALQIYLPVFILLMAFSCTDVKEQTGEHTEPQTGPAIPSRDSSYIETFEVTDSTGASQGWGYDIYSNGDRIIHQPTIPAVSGISSFKTEEDASRTGHYAMNKMMKSGSFPTLSIQELDSLGVLK